MPQAPGPEQVPQVGFQNTRDVVAIPRDPVLEEQQRTVAAAVEVTNRIADQQNQIALSQADTEMAVELDKISARYRTDDDWQTAPARARAEAAALYQARGETLRGNAARQAWAERTQERLGRFEIRMRGQSRDRGASLARANLVTLGDRAEALAGDLSQSEEARQLAVSNFVASLESAEQAGLIDPDDGARMEAAFSENVRKRVQDGLRAEVIERIEMDPDTLAEELADDAGPFRMLDPDERARLTRQATQAAGAMAMDEALERTLRTGEIIGEGDLGIDWTAMGDGARLRYAERASAMAQTHALAAEMGELSGLSLSEIATRADQAREAGASNGGAPGATLRFIRRDPAAYVGTTQPNIARLQTQAAEAIRAAQAAPDNGELQAAAARARRAWALESLRAQDALGLPAGAQRINPHQAVEAWARRVRALPADRQQATLDRLQGDLTRMYGDADLGERAAYEHLQAFYDTRDGMNAPEPAAAASAARGLDYDTVRGRIVQALRTGAGFDDPRVNIALSQLSAADRNRLMEDEEINGLLAGSQ